MTGAADQPAALTAYFCNGEGLSPCNIGIGIGNVCFTTSNLLQAIVGCDTSNAAEGDCIAVGQCNSLGAVGHKALRPHTEPHRS